MGVLTDWLKELLIEGILNNLTGLFDTVNTRVGEIAVRPYQTQNIYAPFAGKDEPIVESKTKKPAKGK